MADFGLALQQTFKHEGGYQADPNDKGNWYNGVNYGTNHGITMADCVKFLNADPADQNFVRNLTPAQAAAIYTKGWWNVLYNQIADQLLGEKLFDMGVLFGVKEAVQLLQISLQNKIQIVSDGIFGQQTLTDVNQYGSLDSYRTVLLNHAMNVVNANPSEGPYLRNWTARIQS